MRPSHVKRHGTVSLLAGIDLVIGKVHALVKDRDRSREFIEFLEPLDSAHPARTAIKLILDNHSAHISKEARSLLTARCLTLLQLWYLFCRSALLRPDQGALGLFLHRQFFPRLFRILRRRQVYFLLS